jgi:hypothetical protein
MWTWAMRLSCSTKPKTEEQDKKDSIRKWNSKQRRKEEENANKKRGRVDRETRPL